MTKPAPSSDLRAARLHCVGQPPILCEISQLSSSGVLVSDTGEDKLSLLNVGDIVDVHIHTHNSHLLKIHTQVERLNAHKALLKYIDPLDTSVSNLDLWFNRAVQGQSGNSNQSVIDEINSTCLETLSSLFDDYLENTQSGLLEMAAVAENNTQQNKLFEALTLLNTQSDDIKQRSCRVFENTDYIDEKATGEPYMEEYTFNEENLKLIDQVQFEDWLSLEVIIRRASQQYHQQLVCLEQRYNELFNQQYTLAQLPVGVEHLCHTLQNTLKDYKFEPELLPVVYRFFEEHVISKLDSLYQALNDTFKCYDILPDIDSKPLAKQPANTTGKNAPFESSMPVQEGDSVDSGPQLMDAVKKFQHLIGTAHSSDSNEQAPGNMASMPELIEQLTRLQHDVDSIESLVGDLSLQQALQSNNNINLPQESKDLITLVDSLFKTVDNYPHLSKSLTSSFKRLQIPIAKAALIDPSFFSTNNHPIKRFLDQMIELGLNSEVPNKSLEQLFETLITNINDQFEQDNHVFEQASEALTSTIEQQAKTYSRNTKRIIQTCEGKQQLKLATDTVAREIFKRIPSPKAPKVIVELMDNGWQELLKLTYLKLGPDSKNWRGYLKIIDQLANWLTDLDANNCVKRSIGSTSNTADFLKSIEKILGNAFPGDYRYSDTLSQINAIAMKKSAVEFIEMPPMPQEYDQLAQQLKSSKPELHRWFQLTEQVNIGDEFSYIDDHTGKKNIKLVWVSDDKQHFVFVNNRGQKILDFDVFDLAEELSRGLIPVEKKSELPLVERSLYSTIQQAYETLIFKSSHDELTGLLNRKECERVLGNIIVEAKNNTHVHYCLLYVDVDQFSLINNLHGHVAGDQQLVTLSKLIRDHLPDDTVVARMAGNEFVILLKNRDEQQHLTVSEDLRACIEKHRFTWDDNEIHLTASIGLVIINKYTKNVIDLVRNAIEACKIAKKGGGNRFYDFRQDSELHTRREKLLSWIDKLDHLLVSDKLVLRAQAITPTTGEVDDGHFEILIALKDEQGKLTSPAEFIEAAESYSRMQKVDRWVIDKTFQWLHEIDLGPKKTPSISINLSGNSLNDGNFADFLFGELEKYSIPTEKICFEVTETATINNIAEVADFIREIKKMGCKFSLDDFGSGNASYQYLRHLPVDYIKVDGMFVQEIDKNKNDYALVKSINEIAHLMGKKTVAEYAESQAIIDVLKDIGVDYIQGYAISKPTVLNEIELEPQLTH